MLEMDIEDEDDDDDDNFFTPIKSSMPKHDASPTSATKPTAKPGHNDVKPLDSTNSESLSQLAFSLNRGKSPGVIEKTESIKQIDSDSDPSILENPKLPQKAPVSDSEPLSISHTPGSKLSAKKAYSDSGSSISEDPVVPFKNNSNLLSIKNDSDPISRALNRFSDSSDNSDAHSKSDMDEKSKSKGSKKYGDSEDVSDFNDDDDQLSLPGLGTGTRNVNKKHGLSDELSKVSDVSSIEPMFKKKEASTASLKARHMLGIDEPTPKSVTTSKVSLNQPKESKRDTLRDPGDEDSDDEPLSKGSRFGKESKLKEVLGLPAEKPEIKVKGLDAISASHADVKARHLLGLEAPDLGHSPAKGVFPPAANHSEKLIALNVELAADWGKIEREERDKFDIKVRDFKKGFQVKYVDLEKSEELKFRIAEAEERARFESKIQQLKRDLKEKLAAEDSKNLDQIAADGRASFESQVKELKSSFHAKYLALEQSETENYKSIEAEERAKFERQIIELKRGFKVKLEADDEEKLRQIESDERFKFETKVNDLKRRYNKKLEEEEEEEEEKIRVTMKELKAEHQKNVDLVRSGNESVLHKIQHDFTIEQQHIRSDGEKRMAKLREAEEEKISIRRSLAASELETFEDDIKSKFRLKRAQFEAEEQQRFDMATRDIQAKHETQLSALKEKLKQSQEATLASNLENLSELERIKYDNEQESIRQKYESLLAECKTREQRRFESTRADVEASTEAKIHEIKEASRKQTAAERALADKHIASAEAEAKSRESLERSRIEMESKSELERLRLSLDSQTRKAEMDLRQKHSAEIEALKISSLKETEENKRRIAKEQARMISMLEAEYSRKVADIKNKLYFGEKEEELRVVMEIEQELATRKEKVVANQREVSQREREVEYARQRVELEKEALAQMERGVSAAMVHERGAYRNNVERMQKASILDGLPLATTAPKAAQNPKYSDMLTESDSNLDQLSTTDTNLKSLTEGRINKTTEQRIDRLVDAAFGTSPSNFMKDMDTNCSDELSLACC
ncbi:hypothetical protein HDU98_007195 [Podochytrium sp. JEL0797]|nr:hypothetical protein HDU98_007195 [Podochytrium sp. JEL0797]